MDQAVEQSLITAIRDAWPDVEAIYLHGSLARGQERPQSDVDLAVLMPPSQKASAERRLKLIDTLIDLCGRPVDLSFLSLDQVVFAKEVVHRGVLLYCRDPLVRARFEMIVLSAYALLNEERRPVLEAYGVVHDR